MRHPGRSKDVVVYSDGTVVEVSERYSGKDELTQANVARRQKT